MVHLYSERHYLCSLSVQWITRKHPPTHTHTLRIHIHTYITGASHAQPPCFRIRHRRRCAAPSTTKTNKKNLPQIMYFLRHRCSSCQMVLLVTRPHPIFNTIDTDIVPKCSYCSPPDWHRTNYLKNRNKYYVLFCSLSRCCLHPSPEPFHHNVPRCNAARVMTRSNSARASFPHSPRHSINIETFCMPFFVRFSKNQSNLFPSRRLSHFM